MLDLLGVGQGLVIERVMAQAFLPVPSFLPEQNYLIILAVVVGVLTGLGSVAFIYVLETVADLARGRPKDTACQRS